MNLVKLEARLRDLLEGRIPDRMASGNFHARVISGLADSIRQQVISASDGPAAKPIIITLVVHPDSAWQLEKSDVIEAIRNALESALQEVGLTAAPAPKLALAVDGTVSQEDVRVIASYEIDATEDTHSPAQDAVADPSDTRHLDGAYFIIQGTRVFSIRGTVTNIGRRLDNHLVLDDPRVSRNHAQLRLIGDRFVVFDLASSGGTFVNEKRVAQADLRPGDVLSLAGVTLVFGQDAPKRDAEGGDTAPNPTPSVEDRATLQMLPGRPTPPRPE